MRHPHLAIGAISVVPPLLASLVLLADPDPIDISAAALIAVGLMILSVVSLSGLLLARAPWGRWGLAISVALSMVFASVSDSLVAYVIYGVGLIALIGLLGPWLQLWVRHQPSAEAPGAIPIILTSVGAVAPLYIGVCAAGGASAVHWVLAVLAVLCSVAYGRGIRAGLWMYRLVWPLATLAAASQTSAPGSAALILGGAVVTVLAWTPAARRTTTIITPPLPAPVRRSP
ncbi:MAG: hypothetical protein ACR2N2_12575 [Acidimicrobiia bacterium]